MKKVNKGVINNIWLKLVELCNFQYLFGKFKTSLKINGRKGTNIYILYLLGIRHLTPSDSFNDPQNAMK